VLRALRCCLNPKVVGSLIAVAAALWLIAPATDAAALPLLVALVCPLSMGAMAWQMRGSRTGSSSEEATSKLASATPDGIDAELRSLREDITIARAHRQLAHHDSSPQG